MFRLCIGTDVPFMFRVAKHMFVHLLFLYFCVISPGMGVPTSGGGDSQQHLVVHTDGLCGLEAVQHCCLGTSQ